MGEKTAIEWCDHTFNPWRGCARVSEGCRNCYAETLSKRNPKVLGTWGVEGERAIAAESYWLAPLKWNAAAQAEGRRARVFCASLADWLEDRPDLVAPRARLFKLIAGTPWLEWLLLTKRPQNFEKLTPRGWMMPGVAPRNIRVGATAEDQRRLDERMPWLVAIPLPNFVSVEPMLSEINLRLGSWWPSGIDWVICGGESGGEARPMHPSWARSVRDQCAAAGVPFLFKQWGEWAPGECADFTPTRTELTAEWLGDKWMFGSLTPRESEDLHRDDEPDLYRLGKKRAGRLLDGIEWSQMPEVR